MALSNSTDFTLTVEKVIQLALRKIGIAKQDSPTTLRQFLDPAMDELNILLKHWHNVGLQLWKLVEIKIVSVEHKNTYVLGPNTSAVNVYSQTKRTQAFAAAISAATTIDVTATTGDITSGMLIDVHLADGTVHSTTVSGTPSVISGGLRVTLTDALDAALDINGQVVVWNTENRYPLRVISGFTRTLSSTYDTDVPLRMMAKEDWAGLASKRTEGTPTHLWYDRQQAAGYLHVWPQSDDNTKELHFLVAMPLDDIDASSNNIDIRPELMKALIYTLASDLGDSYDGVDPQRYAQVALKAKAFRDEAMMADDEHGTSLIIGPDQSYYEE